MKLTLIAFTLLFCIGSSFSKDPFDELEEETNFRPTSSSHPRLSAEEQKEFEEFKKFKQAQTNNNNKIQKSNESIKKELHIEGSISRNEIPDELFNLCNSYITTNSRKKDQCHTQLRSVAVICKGKIDTGKDECNDFIKKGFPKCLESSDKSSEIICLKDLKVNALKIKLNKVVDSQNVQNNDCDLKGRESGYCGNHLYVREKSGLIQDNELIIKELSSPKDHKGRTHGPAANEQ